ncbi:MAG TPA: hypothetical protein PLJ37_01395 [Chitinophagales bacterium]|nr:hypothetical protein [Chitinophagales bacterium]MCB9075299.1 hypothetical protein [Chitinophagales bacterium]HMU97253.1 hypothetical protein [Chitinophagales bacterium]HMV02056.1 hypothetical protein [Chitinophagales bacterium]HMW93770.1 hypothetical protein [Chitinophagales bacterium]
MKTINKIFASGLLLIFISLVSSCSDGIFNVHEQYKLVFWFNQSSSRTFLDDGVDSLTIYVNYQSVAKTPVDDVYWASSPTCDDKTAITATISLKPSQAEKVIISVKDQTGFEYQSSVVNLNSTLENNYCNSFEIVPSEVKIVH